MFIHTSLACPSVGTCRFSVQRWGKTVSIVKYSILLFLCLAVLFSQAMAGTPIKIGAIFSQTGIAASHNEPLIPMVELAIDEINEAGGIFGSPIQLILLDNRSTPIGASMAAQEAVRLDVTAVIGAHWSSHSLAMAPILQKAGIPMISPGSTNPRVTRIGDYIFRACFLDSFQGTAMARFALNDLKAQTAVIVRNIDEDYSVMLAEYFKKTFVSNDGLVLLDTGYRGKAIDFKEIIKEAKSLHPDVLYLPGYTRDSGFFIKQAHSLGLHTIFLGGDAWDEIDKYAGDALSGSFQSAAWHPKVPFPKSNYLKHLYKRKYQKQIENVSAPLAYDAVTLLADAIERAGSLDREKIKAALAHTKEFKGATGIITFDENGDPKDKEVIIIKYQKGIPLFYKTIKP